MKILFLDIDGVLNSLASTVAIGLSHPAKNIDDVILDPVCVGLLREICKTCDFDIYIHSTWSQGRDALYFKNLFSRYGIDTQILERVHNRDERAVKIRQACQHYRPDNFVILDDADLSKEFGENFIFVDNRNGLGWEHYEKVLNRFGKEVPLILF